MRMLRWLWLAVLAGLATGAAQAQTYPSKPITLLFGLPAGGAVDMVARLYGDLAGTALGQRIIVEAKPGAAGVVAASQLVQAAPDGYTLMVALGGMHTITPALQSMPFDPINDFEPITLLFSFPTFLAVPMASPVKTVADLVAMSKSKPGGLNFGSQGVGSPQHLIGALLQEKTGMTMTTVHYKGGMPVVLDLAAGRVDFAFGSYAILRAQLEDQKIRFIAIAAERRWDKLPDVPTLAESGYAGAEVDTWFGLVAPRGTPKLIVQKLHDAFAIASRDPNLNARLAGEGLIVRTGTPEELTALMVADTAKFARVIKAQGIKAE